MTVITDFDQYDGIGLAELIAKGAVSAEDVLETSLSRIDAVNGAVNAISQRMDEFAKAQLTHDRPQSLLSGVPYPIKDLGAEVKGTLTSNGSRRFTDVSDHDSTLIMRYRAAGLIFVGKTNTPEFGLTVSTEPERFGPTRNPWNLDRIAGGSSGGAAAAVASGISPIAHATDGGGSIRVPASCCGLFGLKPSRGRNPSGPDRGEGWSGLACGHAVTRSVRDSAALLDISWGPEEGEPYPPPPGGGPFLEAVMRQPGRLRVAFSTQAPTGVPVDPECVTAVEEAVKLLADLGHDVVEATPGFNVPALGEALGLLISANSASTVRLHEKATGRVLLDSDFEPITWRTISRGREASAEDYATALVRIHEAGRIAARFHRTYDVFVQPVLAKPPLEIGILRLSNPDVATYMKSLMDFTPFTAYANMTGQPSMSLPLHWTQDGLPVGVMVTGRYGEEALLFSLAAQIEAAKPWFHRRATL
jgi:Asp-tRNA(Asn)/Glu-tRNA(Gln) amidotransferase A subunit family amidase